MADDQEKLLELIGVAKRAGLKSIFEKVQQKKSLTLQEMKLLEQYETEIRAKKEEGDQAPAAAAAWDGVTELKNALEVAEYLKASGWKVSKSSVYGHVKQGKLRPDPKTGTFEVKNVDRYAASYLVREAVREKDKAEDLQQKKLKWEIARLEEQTRREQLKRMTEEGKLIPRDQVELELAARAAILDTMRRNSIISRASERVALVGGDPGKIQDLIQYEMDIHAEEMTQFASTKEYQVLFEIEPQRHTKEV